MKQDERNKKQYMQKDRKFTSGKFTKPKKDYKAREFKYDEHLALTENGREEMIDY
jgi:hypothetical protein